MPRYDLVLDGSDNFATRYLVNAACVAAGRPLIPAAMSQWEGQIALFHPAGGGPCYQCLFPEPPAPELTPSCAQAGIVGALPGVMGSMMALEAIKLVARAGTSLRGALLVYDGLHADFRRIRIARAAGLPGLSWGRGFADAVRVNGVFFDARIMHGACTRHARAVRGRSEG